MVNTEETFSSGYMSIDTTQDGQIWEIADEGELKKAKFKGQDEKEVLNITVTSNGKKLTYTPWDKDGRTLQDAFGFDTKDWVGKRFTVLHIDKKMHIKPIVAERV